MRITADTNLLVRAATGDDPVQAEAAERLLGSAETVAIPLAVFCELSWVLSRCYFYARSDVALVIRLLVGSETVSADRDAVAAGLAMMARGEDFADGVIAEDGKRLGGDVFASFDGSACERLGGLGYRVELVGR